MTTKMVNMEFDGKAVSVPEGMTLVDAAATVGVHIPNLCHIKELRGVGACRMCMVEVEGMKTPVTGCTTRTKEGMKVQTKTAKVEEIRKFVTDLILSFHPLDCMTCPKAGACDLQRYAADLKIQESSFGRKTFNYPLNDRSPFITIDNNYCILCGRCVRVCKEQGTNVLDFMGRGITTKVSTALDKPLHESGCTFCGSCVDACPVNTIMERDRWQHGREWDLEKKDSVCTACASGCSVVVSKKNGKIVKVNAREDNGYLCAIGRFGFDSQNAGNRVTAPLIRQGSKLAPAEWGEALKAAAEGLKKGGANAAFLASGSLSTEEAYAIQSLARDVVGSANIDTNASAYAAGLVSALRAMHGNAGIGIAAQSELASADCVVVIGADPSQKRQKLQEVDVMIRRRAQAGAKVVVISTEKTDLAGHQNAILLQVKAGTDAVAVAGLMSAVLAEGVDPSAKGLDGLKKVLISAADAASASGAAADTIAAAAKAYAAAKNPVVVIGTGVSMSEDASMQALNLALVKGAGVLPLMLEANALGVLQAGCHPDLAPGFAKVKKTGQGYREMLVGAKAALVAGPLADGNLKADFLVVMTSHMSPLAEKADVVLPMTALYERDGSITNVYGVQKSFAAAKDPEGVAKNGAEIAAELSLVMSKTKGFKMKDVEAAVKKLKAGKQSAASFKPVAAKGANAAAVSATAMLSAMNAGMLAESAVKKVLVDVSTAVSR
ncbi:MAG: molybdopterin-dependent oxidoreductase [Nitrospiraceae bacterium]|nr:molybdopterin-dependent oxidoreductase [Nitrospiraceae bacterium]